MKIFLSEGDHFSNEEVTCSMEKENGCSTKHDFEIKNDEIRPRSILYLSKKDKHNDMLEQFCEALNKVNLGMPIMVKEFEQDFIDS